MSSLVKMTMVVLVSVFFLSPAQADSQKEIMAELVAIEEALEQLEEDCGGSCGQDEKIKKAKELRRRLRELFDRLGVEDNEKPQASNPKAKPAKSPTKAQASSVVCEYAIGTYHYYGGGWGETKVDKKPARISSWYRATSKMDPNAVDPVGAALHKATQEILKHRPARAAFGTPSRTILPKSKILSVLIELIYLKECAVKQGASKKAIDLGNFRIPSTLVQRKVPYTSEQVYQEVLDSDTRRALVIAVEKGRKRAEEEIRNIRNPPKRRAPARTSKRRVRRDDPVARARESNRKLKDQIFRSKLRSGRTSKYEMDNFNMRINGLTREFNVLMKQSEMNIAGETALLERTRKLLKKYNYYELMKKMDAERLAELDAEEEKSKNAPGYREFPAGLKEGGKRATGFGPGEAWVR